MRDSKICFIIGCGRSGTHYLASIIDSSNLTTVTYEDPIIFPAVVSSVTKNKTDLHIAIQEYEKKIQTNMLYVDKSHPNLFNVEELLLHFPNALFVGIYRDVYATTSSLLKHGAADWGNKYEYLKFPNQFLGIDKTNVEYYKTLTLAGKCVFRWVSHRNELFKKDTKYTNVLLLQYEQLVQTPQKIIEVLSKFLNLSLTYEPPNLNCLNKWKLDLTDFQKNEIAQVLDYLKQKNLL